MLRCSIDPKPKLGVGFIKTYFHYLYLINYYVSMVTKSSALFVSEFYLLTIILSLFSIGFNSPICLQDVVFSVDTRKMVFFHNSTWEFDKKSCKQT